MVSYNIWAIGTYGTANHPENCGISTFLTDKLNGLRSTYHGEIGEINIAAISEGKRECELPVTMIIDKPSPSSWRITGNRLETRIEESRKEGTKDIIMYEYEGGLIPDFESDDPRKIGDGRQYCDYLQRFSQNKDIFQFVQMHTVLPKDRVLKRYAKNMTDFGKYADGILVMIEDSKKTLIEDYGVPAYKIKVIPHGIRLNEESREDSRNRLAIPQNQLIFAEPGLRSLNKGNFELIEGAAQFYDECLTNKQRADITTILPGRLHPGFMAQEEGKWLKIYQEKMKKMKNLRINRRPIRIQETENIQEIDWKKYDIVILNKFISTPDLLGMYSSPDGIFTPYPNLLQSSSGIGADSQGTIVPIVTTKTKWACATLNPRNKTPEKGMVIASNGILIDNEHQECIDQISASMKYLMFHEDKDGQLSRINMGHNNYSDGRKKTWGASSRSFFDFVETTRARREGRESVIFIEKKHSKKLERIIKDATSI